MQGQALPSTSLEMDLEHQHDLASKPTRGPGRPRSAKSTQAILDVTLELLAERGFTAMSIDEIARRAHVGKDTLYRRWPSKIDLVIAAFESLAGTQVAVPETGDLRRDLLTYVTDIITLLTTTDFGLVIAGLVGEAARNPDVAREFHGFWASRTRSGRQLLERAAARRDLRPDASVELGLDLILGSIYFRLLMSGAPLDRTFAEALVEHSLQTLAAPTQRREAS